MRTSIVRTAIRIAAPVLVAVLATACGDLYADPVSLEDPSSDGGTVFAIDSSATAPRDFFMPCAVDAPVEGAPCNVPGTTCEYGSSPDMRCNTTLACIPDESFGAAWSARPSVLCPSFQCPSGAIDSLDGTPCGLPTTDAAAPTDADELVCPMADGVCACTTGVDAAHAHSRKWVCVKPGASCPSTRPLAGQLCPSERICDYGSCSFKRGVRMECRSSVWLTGSATCAE